MSVSGISEQKTKDLKGCSLPSFNKYECQFEGDWISIFPFINFFKRLRKEVFKTILFEKTYRTIPSSSQTIQMYLAKLLKTVCKGRRAKTSHADSYWRKAVEVSSLWKDIFTTRSSQCSHRALALTRKF